MVQIIPRVKSSGDRFSEAFANLGHSASQLIPEEMMKKQEDKALSGLIGQDVSKIRDPELRKAIISQTLQGQQKSKLFEQKQQLLGNIFSGNKNESESAMPKQSNKEELGQGFDASSITDEQIAAVTAIDPNVARNLQHAKDVALRERREEKKSKEKKEETLRKETLPIRQELSERGEIARRGIENKQKQLELIDTGNINDPTYATILESIPLKFGQRFLSPETVQYKAGLVQGYGDLKNIFTGATRVKEVEILENKLADLYLTDQQKKAILKSAIDTQKVDLIKEEAAAELEEEGKNFGVLQFRKEVDKKSKPKLDALFNKIIDEQNSIIKDAENRKKIALDDNDPEDAQIIDQILQEAGGDWRKDEKLAKQKGYKF